jgi:hypothetical protein
MPSINTQALNFMEYMIERNPELEAVKQEMYDWAKSAVAFLEKIDSQESKKAKLCQILYFNAVNKHTYGDASQEPLKTLLADLSDCFARPILDAYTQEQLSDILTEAFRTTVPNDV